MYNFIEKWEEIGREVDVRENTIDILESGIPVFRFYLEGGYKTFRIISDVYSRGGVNIWILNLLNETMKELESERDV